MYYYSIEKVLNEYRIAECLFKEGNITEAAKHYKLVIDNYENADDIEKFPNPNCSISLDGFPYPSINDCVNCAEERLDEIHCMMNPSIPPKKKGTLLRFLSWF